MKLHDEVGWVPAGWRRWTLLGWLGVCLLANWTLRPGDVDAGQTLTVDLAAADMPVADVRSRSLRAGRISGALRLERGETPGRLFARAGFGQLEANRLAGLAQPYLGTGRLAVGTEIRLEGVEGQLPDRISLALDADRKLEFRVSGASWSVRLDSVPVTPDTLVVTGQVTRALYDARLGGDAERLSTRQKAWMGAELARVYAWQLDVFRDVRGGDSYRVALERRVRPDGSVRDLQIIAAEYTGPEETRQAFWFSSGDEPDSFYYDQDGLSLRGPFLKSPLAVTRVTSRFSGRRFHPVLGRFRSHTGVDYGAPTGTPVRTTGDGTVMRAGPGGDYGLMIEVEHGSGIRTRYAHLSSLAEGIHRGASVEQGQPIGRVGSTGLSTAPHLHYEFLLNGIPTDPTRVDLPVERTLPGEDTARFAAARDRLTRHLDRFPVSR